MNVNDLVDDNDDKFLHRYVTGRRPAHAGVVLYDYCR